MGFRLKYAQARLDKLVTIQTLVKEFQQILRTIQRNTGLTWVPKDQISMKKVCSHEAGNLFDVNQRLKQFIKNLKFAGASTASRPRAVAYLEQANEILFYLWNCSEKEYQHPRMMVQFSFYLDVIANWGLRPGEIVESSSHRGSNEGIHYGDITLSLVRRDEKLVYQVKIMLRNRKFARDDKSKMYVCA